MGFPLTGGFLGFRDSQKRPHGFLLNSRNLDLFFKNDDPIDNNFFINLSNFK
jgi:hypothetical protein